jgi:hypothetical protein
MVKVFIEVKKESAITFMRQSGKNSNIKPSAAIYKVQLSKASQ